MISEQAKQRMRDLAARYPVARSAVMPALYIAQQEEGYINKHALETVAEAIGLTVDDVASVARQPPTATTPFRPSNASPPAALLPFCKSTTLLSKMSHQICSILWLIPGTKNFKPAIPLSKPKLVLRREPDPSLRSG